MAMFYFCKLIWGIQYNKFPKILSQVAEEKKHRAEVLKSGLWGLLCGSHFSFLAHFLHLWNENIRLNNLKGPLELFKFHYITLSKSSFSGKVCIFNNRHWKTLLSLWRTVPSDKEYFAGLSTRSVAVAISGTGGVAKRTIQYKFCLGHKREEKLGVHEKKWKRTPIKDGRQSAGVGEDAARGGVCKHQHAWSLVISAPAEGEEPGLCRRQGWWRRDAPFFIPSQVPL